MPRQFAISLEGGEDEEPRIGVLADVVVVRAANLEDVCQAQFEMLLHPADRLERPPEELLPRLGLVPVVLAKAEGAARVDPPATIVVVEDDEGAVFLRRGLHVGPVELVDAALAPIVEAGKGLRDEVPRALFEDRSPGPANHGVAFRRVNLTVFEPYQRKAWMFERGDAQWLKSREAVAP